MNDYNPYDCSQTFEQHKKHAKRLMERAKEKEWETMKKEIEELKKRIDKLENEQ